MGQTDTRCVLNGGIIATASFEYSPPVSSPLVDMVFVIDTSGSMNDEWDSICGVIDRDVVSKLKENNIDLKYAIYGLGETKECAKGAVPKTGQEDWGQGIIWAANEYAWRSDTRRIIVPVSDEDLVGGDPKTDPESENKITEAINTASGKKAAVYGIIGNGASAEVTDEMTRISSGTGGKATRFTDPEKLAEALIEIGLKRAYPVYAVSSNATIYMNQTAPNVWVLYQNESQNVTVKVKSATSDRKGEGDENGMEDMTLTVHPSIMLIETANMPFNVTYAGITRDGSRYNITRIYVPNETGINYDYGKEFIVTSKLIVNYTLLETADTLIIDLNNSYFTQMRRDVSYVACSFKKCSTGSGMTTPSPTADQTKPRAVGASASGRTAT